MLGILVENVAFHLLCKVELKIVFGLFLNERYLFEQLSLVLVQPYFICHKFN